MSDFGQGNSALVPFSTLHDHVHVSVQIRERANIKTLCASENTMGKKQHINYLFLLPTNPFWSNLYDVLTLLCPSIALIFLDSQKRVISVGAWLWFSLSYNNM